MPEFDDQIGDKSQVPENLHTSGTIITEKPEKNEKECPKSSEKEDFEIDDIYRCLKCRKKEKSKQLMSEHILECWQKSPFKLKIEKYQPKPDSDHYKVLKYKNQAVLSKNEENVNEVDKQSLTSSSLKCQHCLKDISKFAFSSHLKACEIYFKFTEQIYTPFQRYKCQICHYESKSRYQPSAIYAHIRMRHPQIIDEEKSKCETQPKGEKYVFLIIHVFCALL